MSIKSPIINEWERLGLEWHYIIEPALAPFVVPANARLQVPVVAPVDFQAPEGMLINFTGSFDNPLCGIDIEMYPGFNARQAFTVNNITAGGLANQPWTVNTRVPPATPPGVYVIEYLMGPSDWLWKERCRLYVFNTDAVNHICLGLGYVLVVLDEPRPKKPYLGAIDKLTSALQGLVSFGR